jgi:hypothetical protein
MTTNHDERKHMFNRARRTASGHRVSKLRSVRFVVVAFCLMAGIPALLSESAANALPCQTCWPPPPPRPPSCCPPPTPTNFKVVAVDGVSVTVTWQEPSGTPAPTSFYLYAENWASHSVVAGESLPGSTRWATLSGLAPHTLYIVAIVAQAGWVASGTVGSTAQTTCCVSVQP